MVPCPFLRTDATRFFLCDYLLRSLRQKITILKDLKATIEQGCAAALNEVLVKVSDLIAVDCYQQWPVTNQRAIACEIFAVRRKVYVDLCRFFCLQSTYWLPYDGVYVYRTYRSRFLRLRVSCIAKESASLGRKRPPDDNISKMKCCNLLYITRATSIGCQIRISRKLWSISFDVCLRGQSPGCSPIWFGITKAFSNEMSGDGNPCTRLKHAWVP